MTITPRVLVPVADGSEDIETVAIIDVLRRAGFDVTVASVMPQRQITAARGTRIVADALLNECADKRYEAIALPGGLPGANHLRDCELLITLLRQQKAEGRLFTAICASPAVVFAHHGLDEGHQSTAHPGFTGQLHAFKDARVVVDRNCITSQGPGTAIEFALAIVEHLAGNAAAQQVAAPMVLNTPVIDR